MATPQKVPTSTGQATKGTQILPLFSAGLGCMAIVLAVESPSGRGDILSDLEWQPGNVQDFRKVKAVKCDDQQWEEVFTHVNMNKISFLYASTHHGAKLGEAGCLSTNVPDGSRGSGGVYAVNLCKTRRQLSEIEVPGSVGPSNHCQETSLLTWQRHARPPVWPEYRDRKGVLLAIECTQVNLSFPRTHLTLRTPVSWHHRTPCTSNTWGCDSWKGTIDITVMMGNLCHWKQQTPDPTMADRLPEVAASLTTIQAPSPLQGGSPQRGETENVMDW